MSVGIDATELFSPYDPYHYDGEYSIPTIELSSLRYLQVNILEEFSGVLVYV